MKKTGIVYGPVPSRRLGISLGIDLTPFFHCTMDCIYCEINVRKNRTLVVPHDKLPSKYDVLSKLSERLREISPRTLDFVTFSGSGEPTLHPDLRDIAIGAKKIMSEFKIPSKLALITNSTLLYRREIKTFANLFDVILGKLDAATEEVLKKINNPIPQINLEAIVDGLRETAKGGNLWITTMFVKGYNDSPEEIKRLTRLINEISPSIYLVDSPCRPPGNKIALSQDELLKIANSMEQELSVELRIVSRTPLYREIPQITHSRLVEEILSVLAIRPSTIDDLSRTLGEDEKVIRTILDMLVENFTIEKKDDFYRVRRQATLHQ
ncbi:MAG: radical SAM protein [Candidatus Korarchaeota archaeon]